MLIYKQDKIFCFQSHCLFEIFELEMFGIRRKILGNKSLLLYILFTCSLLVKLCKKKYVINQEKHDSSKFSYNNLILISHSRVELN